MDVKKDLVLKEQMHKLLDERRLITENKIGKVLTPEETIRLTDLDYLIRMILYERSANINNNDNDTE